MERSLDSLSGARVAFFASTGGHLAQASKWHKRLRLHRDSVFVTFPGAQAESLAKEHQVVTVPYVPPRGWRQALSAASLALRLPALQQVEAVVSSGAGIALAGVPLAYRRRIPFFYLESVSRFDAPSLTGKVLGRFPRVHRFAQHSGYRGRWTRVPSLLNDYRSIVSQSLEADRPLNIFVTLGTIRPYRMDRLIDDVLAASRAGDEITWQTGATDGRDLPGRSSDYLNADEFAAAVESADVVVTHAGVGTLLQLLDAGHYPVMVPRLAHRGEHIDDHQLQAAMNLSSRGLAQVAVEGLTRAHLISASQRRITFGDGD